MKVFNTTANCVPEENYMVDIGERLKAIKKMVDEKKYFTVNRAPVWEDDHAEGAGRIFIA